MNRRQITNAVALVAGLVMVIGARTLPLHQGDMPSQTTGEFILYGALSVGGVLIALFGFFGLVRSSRRRANS
jgi:TRAP-type C4-dicarboxylate transport system permease small subunit